MAKKNEKNTAAKENAAVDGQVNNSAEQSADENAQCGGCAELAEQVDKLKAELEQEKDRALRLAAEYDNFRRRTQKEKEASYGDAKAQTLAELLPVLDNFERAAQNTEASLEDYAKGVQMTFTQMMEILKKLGVEAFGEPNEKFDPNIHNAVMHIDDDTLEENVITDVFQKGYRIGDRILRHAMVKVAN